MARIAGVEIPDNARAEYALTKIKGVGFATAQKVLETIGMDRDKKVKDLDPGDISAISTQLEKYLIEGELAREVRKNIARLRNIGSYKGTRHAKGLPVRGQRTRSNARTKRGKRKTIGAFKKETLTRLQHGAKKE